VGKIMELVYGDGKEYGADIYGWERSWSWYRVVGRSMGLRNMGGKDHGAGIMYGGGKEYGAEIHGWERSWSWYMVVGRSTGLRYMGKKDHGAGILWWEGVWG
jgi:hypothetical protein